MDSVQAEKIANDHAAQLAERFDAVQIIASWVEDGVTHCVAFGRGNVYARTAMAQALVTRQNAQDAYWSVRSGLEGEE